MSDMFEEGDFKIEAHGTVTNPEPDPDPDDGAYAVGTVINPDEGNQP